MGSEFLSQSDIDSLVAGLGQKDDSSPAARARPAPMPPSDAERLLAEKPKPASTVSQAPAPGPEVCSGQATDGLQSRLLSSLEAKVTDISHRLGRLESTVGRLERLEREMADAGTDAQGSPQQLRAVSKRVEELGQEIKSISTKLQGSLGYAAYYTFKCDKCQSQGSVATVFQCTKCGHQSWRGWWPKKKE